MNACRCQAVGPRGPRGRGVPLVLALLLALLALPALRAADELPVTGPIVELPKFEVKDTRLLPLPESWRYAELPGFEVLSNISERETKRFVQDFLLLQEVIEILSPGMARGRTPVPTALILCGRGNGFDEFLPADGTVERFGSNSLFYYNAERAAIVVDFALAELQLDTTTTEEADPYRGFYLAYFRFLIRRQVAGTAPPWFEEGLVQIFAATDFNRKWITFAQIGDGFGGSKNGDFNRMLNERHILSFKEFLEEKPGQQPAPEHNAFWSAQCYGFVHMCLYGLNQKYTKKFIRYVQRLQAEEPTEALFEECFGLTYKKMALELRGYVGFTNYKSMQYRAKKGQEIPAPPEPKIGDAPDAVVGRLKGEVMRLAGRDEPARNTLIAPYIRGERDPRLLAALGLDELAGGRDERARKFLEAAVAAKVDRARAYYELARLRFTEVRAKPAAAGKLDARQLDAVLAPLQAGRTKPPQMASLYALMIDACSLAAEPISPPRLAEILEGVRHFPREASLVLRTALFAAQGGFPETAHDLALHGLKIAKTSAQRDRFEALRAAMAKEAEAKKAPPAPASAGPAVPTAKPESKPSPFAR